jgi:hypothetical protein
MIPTLLAANLGPLIWLLSLVFFIRSPTLFLANRNMNLESSTDREKVYKRCVLSPFDQFAVKLKIKAGSKSIITWL